MECNIIDDPYISSFVSSLLLSFSHCPSALDIFYSLCNIRFIQQPTSTQGAIDKLWHRNVSRAIWCQVSYMYQNKKKTISKSFHDQLMTDYDKLIPVQVVLDVEKHDALKTTKCSWHRQITPLKKSYQLYPPINRIFKLPLKPGYQHKNYYVNLALHYIKNDKLISSSCFCHRAGIT